MTAEDMIAYVWGGIGLLGLYLAWAVIRAGRILNSRKWTSAWHLSTRLTGWLPFWGTALLLGGLTLFAPSQNGADLAQFGALRVTATLLPLVAGCHLAFAFSPADESALEDLLAAPRPLAWVLFERVLLMAMPYVLLAILGNTIVFARFSDEFAGMFLRWVPPFLFFMSVGVLITLSTRQAAFGMTLTMVVWFGLAFMGNGMLLRWPYLWPLHVYMQPDQAVSPSIFTLHQVWITLASLGMFVRAAAQLNDHEKLLTALKT